MWYEVSQKPDSNFSSLLWIPFLCTWPLFRVEVTVCEGGYEERPQFANCCSGQTQTLFATMSTERKTGLQQHYVKMYGLWKIFSFHSNFFLWFHTDFFLSFHSFCLFVSIAIFFFISVAIFSFHSIARPGAGAMLIFSASFQFSYVYCRSKYTST